MAQITLNILLTSESFSINDDDIIFVDTNYVDGVATGSVVTIVDTANADVLQIIVEETPSEIAATTNKLVQITLSSNQTPYIAISRIKEIITNGDVANIIYDDNGNTFKTLDTTMTTEEILDAIATDSNSVKQFIAVIEQTSTNPPEVLYELPGNNLTDPPTFYYDSQGTFRVGSDDFGLLDDNKVFPIIQSTGNQGTAARFVDCYTTTGPIDRGEKCEIALESYNNSTLTNGIIFRCTLIIYVKV